jgi:hypothetical protein
MIERMNEGLNHMNQAQMSHENGLRWELRSVIFHWYLPTLE